MEDLPEQPRKRGSSQLSGPRKSRAKLPRISQSYTSSQPSHHKEVHQAIALFTVLYLFSGCSYTVTQSIIRIITIFFGSNTSCYLHEYLQFVVALTRSMLYLLFLSRLYLTFLGSHLAYKKWTLIILGITILLANIGAIIFWIIDTSNQIRNNQGQCSNIDYTFTSMTVILVDSLINIVLLYLFVHKLSQLIRTQTAGYDVLDGAGDPSALKRIKDLIKLMTKLTVLACVAVISSWITTLIFLSVSLPHIIQPLDVVVGTFCILFCYEFHKTKYMNWCFLCRQCCYHVCFWWFISEDYICKKNDEKDQELDGFEGGCCAVICVFCKYTNDDEQVLVDDSQELMVGDKAKVATLRAKNMLQPKEFLTLPTTNMTDSNMTQSSQNNKLNIPTKDGGKSFTEQILKSPTDEFTDASKTQSTTRNDSLKRGGDENKFNFAFSHRAYTLKKLHQILSEDEGIAYNYRDLRFTLRSSKRLHTLRSTKSITTEIIQESMDIDEQNELEQQKENDKNKEKESMDNDTTAITNNDTENHDNSSHLKPEEANGVISENDNESVGDLGVDKQKSAEIVYSDSALMEDYQD